MLNLYIVLVILNFLIGCSSSPFQEWVLVEPSWRIGARRALLKNWCSSSPFEEWVLVEPFLKNECSSSPLECRGAIQLEQFNNCFPRTFFRKCLLNDYIICLRMCEKWYYATVFIVIIVKTMFRFWPRSPSSLNQPRNKGLGPQPQCIFNFIRSGQELG